MMGFPAPSLLDQRKKYEKKKKKSFLGPDWKFEKLKKPASLTLKIKFLSSGIVLYVLNTCMVRLKKPK